MVNDVFCKHDDVRSCWRRRPTNKQNHKVRTMPLLNQPLNSAANLKRVVASIKPRQKLTVTLDCIGSTSTNLLVTWMKRSQDAMLRNDKSGRWKIDGIYFHALVEAALEGDNLLEGPGTILFEGKTYRDTALTRGLIAQLAKQRAKPTTSRISETNPVFVKHLPSNVTTSAVHTARAPAISPSSPVAPQVIPQPRPGRASARFDSENIGAGVPAPGGYRVR